MNNVESAIEKFVLNVNMNIEIFNLSIFKILNF